MDHDRWREEAVIEQIFFLIWAQEATVRGTGNIDEIKLATAAL